MNVITKATNRFIYYLQIVKVIIQAGSLIPGSPHPINGDYFNPFGKIGEAVEMVEMNQHHLTADISAIIRVEGFMPSALHQFYEEVLCGSLYPWL